MQTRLSIRNFGNVVDNTKNHLLKVYCPEAGRWLVKVRPRVPHGGDESVTPDPVVFDIDTRHIFNYQGGIEGESPAIFKYLSIHKLAGEVSLYLDNCAVVAPIRRVSSTESYPYMFYHDHRSEQTNTIEDLSNPVVPDWIPTVTEVKEMAIAKERRRLHELATHVNYWHNAMNGEHEQLKHFFKGIGLAERMLNRVENPPEVLVDKATSFRGTGISAIKSPSEPMYFVFIFSTNAHNDGRISVRGATETNDRESETINFDSPKEVLISTHKYKSGTRFTVAGDVVADDLTVLGVKSVEQSFGVPSGFFHEGKVITGGRRRAPVNPLVKVNYETGEGLAEFNDALYIDYDSQRPKEGTDPFDRQGAIVRAEDIFRGVHNPVLDRFTLHRDEAIADIEAHYARREWTFTNHETNEAYSFLYQSPNQEDWDDLEVQYYNALYRIY